MNSTFLLFYSPRPRGNWSSKLWELSVQLKIPEISVGTSIGTDHFGLIRPEYSGPALKVFHFDRSGYLGGSAWDNTIHLSELLSPVPLFCILLTRTITKSVVAWFGSVQPECTVSLGTWNFRNFFKPESESAPCWSLETLKTTPC